MDKSLDFLAPNKRLIELDAKIPSERNESEEINEDNTDCLDHRMQFTYNSNARDSFILS